MDGVPTTSLIYAREAHAELLRAALPGPCICAKSRSEFLSATLRHRAVIAFVDVDLLPQVEGETSNVPIVGILDDTLVGAVQSLELFPWLSHLVAASMLATPLASSHIQIILERLAHGPEHPLITEDVVGRVALLTSSNRRESRFERMSEFFTKHGLSPRVVSSLCDVAEELVTNALYDAPVEAGYFKTAVARTEDVELPPEHACEISYGLDQGSAFVRIRDPFGALTRTRLLGVLNRCHLGNVSLDESRGGAGLGLWRVFSLASTIGITVIPGRVTDIVVRIEAKSRRSAVKHAPAVHLFFPDPAPLDGTPGRFAAESDHDLMDESFTGIRAA